MGTAIETVIILDEVPPVPVTLSGEVAMLCAAGERDAAMITLARAIERLAGSSQPLPELTPRIEEVLRSWGYVPLTDELPGLPG